MSDRDIIRELAKKYMEIASSEKHKRMRERFKATNDLKIVRPPALIDEIPWHEMNLDGELDCKCAEENMRGVEYGLRTALFREKHFKCDNFIEPVWTISKSYSSTGDGLNVEETRLATDKRNGIVSHAFTDVLRDESAAELIKDPVITAYPENDRKSLEFFEELLGGIIPVELRGHYFYWSAWDRISYLRGVEPVLIDIYERPDYLRRLVGLLTRGMASAMTQMDALGLLDQRCSSLHCTPGAVSPPDTRETPADKREAAPEADGGQNGYHCRDVWFRTMAQMFSTVSPQTHDEFDIAYVKPLAERCAFTYYGCCEPLHDRIDVLKKIKNLRKIGVSPWADVNRSAEAIGGAYVLSRKPNPANVAVRADPEVIRAEIIETLEAARKFGCPCDITLKDISTVGYRPENLIIWAKTVSDALDEYYGEN